MENLGLYRSDREVFKWHAQRMEKHAQSDHDLSSLALQFVWTFPQKKAPDSGAFFYGRTGDDLLSHTVTRAVSSALESLTSVFGMGTGGTSPLVPPET